MDVELEIGNGSGIYVISLVAFWLHGNDVSPFHRRCEKTFEMLQDISQT